jgi:uncharacterized protein
MYILLPPSEGKNDAPGRGVFSDRHPELLEAARPVLRHLKKLKAGERPKFYGVKDLEKARAAHKLNLGVTEAPVLPAVERYTGVVYDHIGLDSIACGPRAKKRILVVSGLFGLLHGTDGIPRYKQPINPWLTRYWKSINGERLQSIAKGAPVLDLLSQSYQKAVDYPGRIVIDFRVQGGKKAAGHFGKAIKGRFVRFLLENGIQDIADFAEFTEDGYRFDGENFIQE